MKKAFSILTGLALSLALLTSCEKNPETDSNNGISDAGAVTGVLKDAETGKVMANTYIALWNWGLESDFGLTAKTNTDGRFFFGYIPPSLGYLFGSIHKDNIDTKYQLVYFSIDGNVRDLSWSDAYDEDDFYYLKEQGHYFAIKAGQVREVELRVKKQIDEEED